MAGWVRAARRTAASIGLAVALLTTGVACTGDDNASTGGEVSPGQGVIGEAPVASDADLAASPTAQAIRARGTLVIGGDENLPLLSQRNPITGSTDGFDATLGKMLAKYIIGRPSVNIVTTTPETREAMLKTGTVDAVIRIYTITAERAQRVAFAGPYLLSGQAIATLKGTTGIDDPGDLNGKTVLAVAGTTSVAAIQQRAPGAKITTFGTAEECVQALEQGKGDAYVHDLTVLAGEAQLDSKLQISGQPFTSEPYGIGLKLDDDSFKRFVNEWLRKIEAAGLWQRAWQETLGTVVTGGVPSPPAIGSVPGS